MLREPCWYKFLLMMSEKKVRNYLVSLVTVPNGVQIRVTELTDKLEEEKEKEID